MAIKNRSQDEIKKIIYDYMFNGINTALLVKKYKISFDTLKKIFVENNIKITWNRNSKTKIITKNNKFVQLRKCSKCNEYKELNEFYLNKDKTYRSECKECDKKVKYNYDYKKYTSKNKRKEYYIKQRNNDEYLKNYRSYQKMYKKYGKEIKRCSSCGEYKSINDYNKYTLSKDGLFHVCKDCLNQTFLDDKRLQRRLNVKE